MLITVRGVAEKLGISPRGVRKAAEAAGVGTLLGNQLVFSEEELKTLRKRPRVGRPTSG